MKDTQSKEHIENINKYLILAPLLLGGVGVGSGSEHRLQYEVTARPQDTVRVEFITNPDSCFLQ